MVFLFDIVVVVVIEILDGILVGCNVDFKVGFYGVILIVQLVVVSLVMVIVVQFVIVLVVIGLIKIIV